MSAPRRSLILSVEERRHKVILSTHYYVLSLGAGTCLLFEAFRDLLIEIENRGFPVTVVPAGAQGSSDSERLWKTALAVDESFGRYYLPEPLALILVGEEDFRAAFLSVTEHKDAVIGSVEGDHSDTSTDDMGKIVWPVVKEAMSGILADAMRELEIQEEKGESFSGIEAVARAVKTGERGTLLVEDDYHLRGSIGSPDRSPIISPEIDIREVMDDAVDMIVDKVLESGGKVIFAPGGSLAGRGRIALFHHRTDE